MVEDLKKKRVLNICYLIVSIIFILYVTILTRMPTLTSTVRLVPFWSLASKGYIRQVLLNIALFVPLGYFLSAVIRHRYIPIVTALGISVCIELLQYFSCRGMLDIDDIISNMAGAVIGLGLFHWFGEKRIVRLGLLIAELAGCIIVGVLSFNYTADVRITEQFDFDVLSVKRQESSIQIEGRCSLNNHNTLNYQIVLVGQDSSLITDTVIQKDSFVATATGADEKRYEVQVQFKGHKPMPAKAWINGNEVEYVPYAVEPEGEMIQGVLKAYSPEYDTFVYQRDDRLIWLIGWNIDASTEIICHVHTNEPEKLPESRVLYGYDNRGFRVGSQKEQEKLGKYRVFEDVIPNTYNVTAVVVGFKEKGKINWTESFRVK